MASLTVVSVASIAASASSLSGARLTSSTRVSTSTVKVAAVRCQGKSDEEVMQRRAVITAAASALVAAVSGVALAEEPKKGSKEAKKVYASVCVSNPTASICHG